MISLTFENNLNDITSEPLLHVDEIISDLLLQIGNAIDKFYSSTNEYSICTDSYTGDNFQQK